MPAWQAYDTLASMKFNLSISQPAGELCIYGLIRPARWVEVEPNQKG